MALSKTVEESLKEAEASLRNALAFAARQEKPYVAKNIADIILQIDTLITADSIMDKLESRRYGDSGTFGSFFDE
jgi:hypothetical protein